MLRQLITEIVVILLCCISCKYIWIFCTSEIVQNPSFANWFGTILLTSLLILASCTIYNLLNSILLAFFGKNNLTHSEKKL
jgi:hypothetical protein